MKQSQLLIGVLLSASFAAALPALADGLPYTVENLSIRQRWPWSRKVDIRFNLVATNGGTEDVSVDLTPVLKNGKTVLDTSFAAWSGDRQTRATFGAKHFVWDPTVDYAGQTFGAVNVEMEQTLSKPLYMAVDLRKAAGEQGQITYYQNSDFLTNALGDYCQYYLTFRRIPATTSREWLYLSGGTNYYYYGSPATEGGRQNREGYTKVRMTNDYWMCISELTAGQTYWASQGTLASNTLTRLIYVSYNMMRGSVADGINWPTTRHEVATNSYLHYFRERTGLQIDMPTGAEWEYACKAGTTTPFSDGVVYPTNDVSLYWQSMNRLGRYNGTGGVRCDTVPSYLPNAWGLYDMHGNVDEMTLDYGTGKQSDEILVNPEGDSSGSSRSSHGGYFNAPALSCRSASVSGLPPDYVDYPDTGFRLCCPYTE